MILLPRKEFRAGEQPLRHQFVRHRITDSRMIGKEVKVFGMELTQRAFKRHEERDLFIEILQDVAYFFLGFGQGVSVLKVDSEGKRRMVGDKILFHHTEGGREYQFGREVKGSGKGKGECICRDEYKCRQRCCKTASQHPVFASLLNI